jgi:hypothetical protein
MNELNLPPHRPLPPQVRDRLRGRLFAPDRSSRLRAPLAAAAGVAVLAAGAMMVSQSVAGTLADYRPGTPPTSTTTSTAVPAPPSPPIPPPDVTEPDARTAADLDRCGAVAAASERAAEFAPRSTWRPLYTVSRRGHRVTAYTEGGGKPGFCDVTATTATVSDPSAETMNLVVPDQEPLTVDGLYLSAGGLLAGIAQGAEELGMAIDRDGVKRFTVPVLRDETFVVDVGALVDGDSLEVWVMDGNRNVLATGTTVYERASVRPVGATATDR